MMRGGYLLSCPCPWLCLCRRSRVRRHIAHASSVLSMPVTIVKIPIMRLTFVSVDSDEAGGGVSKAEACLLGCDWVLAYTLLPSTLMLLKC